MQNSDHIPCYLISKSSYKAAVAAAWSLLALIGTARKRFTCFENICFSRNTFVAAVTVDIFETERNHFVVRVR
jgi:hypothetical protein